MARVETILPATDPAALPILLESAGALVSLRPNAISLDEKFANARPGPTADHEEDRIKEIAESFRSVGQIVPLVVEAVPSGEFVLVDGRRRRAAALILDTDEHPFYLACVTRPGVDSLKLDNLRAAIHANLKRRGYTPLQFAHLCAELRKDQGWKGTKEVAEYLGVSRAQVSQHDKLLHKPDGMAKKVYEDLLSKVGSGRMGADAAFYTLTHVEPAKVETVLPRAQALASEEAGAREGAKATASPRAPNAAERALKTKSPGAKATAAERRAWNESMKALKDQRKKRLAAEKEQKAKAVAKAKAEAKVEKKHLQQAAREEKAIKSDLSKSIPELRALFEKLGGTAYPDVMRNAITTITAWMRGDATDREVMSHWSQVAVLVEQQLERTSRKPIPSKAKPKGKK